MPTYLVAFMVSDFAYVLPSDSNRIYGRPELVESGRLNYSATVTIEVLRVLEEWFDINHGLKKTDQVAVPKPYYEAEAMENWGLVTYKYLFCLRLWVVFLFADVLEKNIWAIVREVVPLKTCKG